MSASQTPPQGTARAGADPSMEDILASIRRILSEEEPGTPPAPASADTTAAAAAEPEPKPDDVLVLDSSMLVTDDAEAAPAGDDDEAAAAEAVEAEAMPSMAAAGPAMPAPEHPAGRMEMLPPTLLAPETEAAATVSMGALMRTLATERTLQVHRGGPTIEEIVREELRPLLKQWLDANLPALVERLVRAEIERVVRQAVP